MSAQLEIVDGLWPGRKIFQGSATAYIRWSENSRNSNCYERDLWTWLFSTIGRGLLSKANILDVGSGVGRFNRLRISQGGRTDQIVALEPNPILAQYLMDRKMGIDCIQDPVSALPDSVVTHQEIDLLSANMLVNHLSTPEFSSLVYSASAALAPGGMFAYTVPEAHRKARKHGFPYPDFDATAEEAAPWGGLVRYYHRPDHFQVQILRAFGFKVTRMHGCFDLKSGDWYANDWHEGPKRTLFIAQKKLGSSKAYVSCLSRVNVSTLPEVLNPNMIRFPD